MKKTNNVQYKMIKTCAFVEDSGVVTSYGICCREEKNPGNGDNESADVEYQVIPGISTKPDFVRELIGKLINHEADPVHLRDLIDDYLA